MSASRPRPTLSSLRFTRILETGLVLALVGCGGSGGSDPALLEVRISVAPTPPLVGPARIVVSVRTLDAGPVEGAQVGVEVIGPSPDVPPVRIEGEPIGEGNYAVPNFQFTAPGEWILRARVELEGHPEVITQQGVRVVQGAPIPGG